MIQNNVELNIPIENNEKIIKRKKLTNLILIVDYDGTNYNGWTGLENTSTIYLKAIKKNKKKIEKTNDVNKSDTVYNTLLNCILRIHAYEVEKEYQINENNLKPFEFIGVSRTDKGVHAKEYICQYISYEKETPCNGNLYQIKRAINGLLNHDIKVIGILNSPYDDFNVRYENLGKIYTYNLDLRIPGQVFERNYAWQLFEDPRFASLINKKENNVASVHINNNKDFKCVNKIKNNENVKNYETNLNFLFNNNEISEDINYINNEDNIEINIKNNDENYKINNENIANKIYENKNESIINLSHEEIKMRSINKKNETNNKFEIKKENEIKNKFEIKKENEIKNKFEIKKENKNNFNDISECLEIINGYNKKYYSQILCDIQKIKECSKLFIGYNNFECFKGSLKGTEKLRNINTFCTIHFLEIYEIKNNIYQFIIQGDRFLYHMIRIIVGTLVQVGMGLLKIEDVKNALYNLKPLKVKLCAPSQGLCLKKVLFNKPIQDLINSSLCY